MVIGTTFLMVLVAMDKQEGRKIYLNILKENMPGIWRIK